MRVVTISRQVGSYGDVVAAIVARKLGLELISREKIHELAQTCDPEYSDACTIYESEHGPGWLERIFFDRPSYTSLFESLAYESAAKGNVVIVDRGAQVVLRDTPGVFRVRMVAPARVRVERIRERFHFSKEEALDFVYTHDRERRNLITAVFDVDPRDWSLYDMILNTHHYDAGNAAEVVISAIENMAELEDKDAVREELNNKAVAKRIETLIRKKLTSVVARNVEVALQSGGNAVLSGRIRSDKDKRQAEEIARNYQGITEVDNQLRVTELSFGL
jgi:cytidylate kinase